MHLNVSISCFIFYIFSNKIYIYIYIYIHTLMWLEFCFLRMRSLTQNLIYSLTPALWRASWPAVSPPGLETAPLATAGLCKGSCELPATLLEVSFPPSRISIPGGVQGKPGGLSKTPATRPTDCSFCCPQGDVSAASDPALADWGTAFSLRLSG